jgi:imidazolonepropionase-like amidohydrolase
MRQNFLIRCLRFTPVVTIAMRCLLVLPLLASLIACGTAREELSSVSLVITNGTVIDGTGAPPISNGLVAIQGDRIVAVGQAKDFTFPAETRVIDASGGTIMPGVINAHVHAGHGATTRRYLFLLDGVTAVCDMGVRLAAMGQFEQEETRLGPAARGFKAGPIITAPGGYPGPYWGFFLNYEIQGADEAQDAVADLHARGADYIKLALEPGLPGLVDEGLPVLELEELRSVVEAAHAHGLLARVHVTQSSMLDIALESDVDVIEHVPMPSYSADVLEGIFSEPGSPRLPLAYEEQLNRMIDQGIVLVPTLDVIIGDSYQRDDIDTETRALILGVLGVVRYFYEAGGVVALGNDYGNPGVKSGMPLREMELLLAAGLTPMDVIEAATRHAAYVCGHGDELGTLASGRLADLIVVDADPLEDIAALDSVSYVVKNGELVFPAK